MFFRGSRYEYVADTEIEGPEGRTIRYKRMRFIPVVRGTLTAVVIDGDRTDLLTYRAIGDPEQFWRLADVNQVRSPADLTVAPGGRVAVPGPGTG